MNRKPDPALDAWVATSTDPTAVALRKAKAWRDEKAAAKAAKETARAERVQDARRARIAAVPSGLYAVDGPVGTRFVHVVYSAVTEPPAIYELKGTPVSHVREMNRGLLTDADAGAVFEAIVTDTPAAAGRRFGVELGCCGRCGALLTNETSRTHGYGPDCYRRRERRSSWLTDVPLP